MGGQAYEVPDHLISLEFEPTLSYTDEEMCFLVKYL